MARNKRAGVSNEKFEPNNLILATAQK